MMSWTSDENEVHSSNSNRHFPWLGLLGAALILFSFFRLPWVSFSFIKYIDLGSELLKELLPDLLGSLFEELGVKQITRLVSWLLAGYLPGSWLWLLMPSAKLFVRLVILLVGIVGAISGIWNLLCIVVPTGTVRRRMGKLQAIFGFLAALLLLLQMPTIDAWGTTKSFLPALFALLMGAQLAYGVWVAWLGLLLVGISGLREGFVNNERRTPQLEPYDW